MVSEQGAQQSRVWLREISSGVETHLADCQTQFVDQPVGTDGRTMELAAGTKLLAEKTNPVGEVEKTPASLTGVLTAEGMSLSSTALPFPIPTTVDVPSLCPSDTPDELSVCMDTVRICPSGQLFGDFELLEEIGRGSMGIVYKARQISLGRVVAIKVIPSGSLARSDEVRRFYAEAEAAASLQHPGIVPIYGIGCVKGVHFYSMRFLEGGSLAQRAPQLAGRWQEIARYVAQVARAVDYAHRHGVLHRDLKPANILLDLEGQPVVSDFGLCQRLPQGEEGSSSMLVGTPLYMAPELAAGRGRASIASDVYSLGAILYELLIGQPPFPEQDVAEVLHRIATEEPVAPSQLRRGVPRDLEAICLKCLSKDPNRRYTSAGALAQDLERFLTGQPVSARPIGRGEQLWRWCKRHPLTAAVSLGSAVAGIVAAAAVLILSVVIAWREREAAKRLQWLHQQTAHARDQAELHWRQTLRLLREAERHQRQAQQEAADLALVRAASALNRSQIPSGLLWLTRALGLIPPEAGERIELTRTMLAGWCQAAHHLSYHAALPERWLSIQFQPELEECLGVGESGVAYRWAYRQGKPPEPVCRLSATRWRDAHWADAGRLIVTWQDHGWHLWNMTGDTRLAEWTTQVPLRCWAVSHYGRAWVVANQTNQIILWQLPAGSAPVLLQRWQLPEPVKLLECRDDASIVVAQTRQGIWILQSQDPSVPDQPTLAVGGIALAVPATDRRVYVGNPRSIVGIHEEAPKRSPSIFIYQVSPLRRLTTSADGRILVSLGEDGVLYVWDSRNGRQVGQALICDGAVSAFSLSPDGKHLVAVSDSAQVRVWKLNMQPAGLEVQQFAGSIAQAVFSPDGQYLLTTSGRTVQMFHRQQNQWQPLWELKVPDLVRQLGLSEDRRHAWVGFHNGQAWVVEIHSSGQPIAQFQHGSSLIVGAIDPQGRWLATAGSDRQVAIWDIGLRQLLGQRWQLHELPTTLAFSNDGQTLAVGLKSGAIALGKIGIPLQEPSLWPAHRAAVTVLQFAQNDRTLVSGGSDGKLLFWEISSGRLLHSDNLEINSVSLLQRARSGELLFAAGRDFSGVLARLAPPRYCFLFEPPRSDTVYARFSPQGHYLATGYADQSVEVWDTRSGYRLLPPLALEARVLALAWTSEREIAIVSADGKVVSRAVPEPMAGDLTSLVGYVQLLTGQHLYCDVVRNLSLEQWQQLAWQRRSAQSSSSPSR